jgi:hypothetical protein
MVWLTREEYSMAKHQSASGTLPPPSPPPPDPRWKRSVDLAIEVLVGTALFLLIVAAGVLINIAADYLRGIGVDGWIYSGLRFMEYSLFVADIILFLLFLARAVIDNIQGAN